MSDYQRLVGMLKRLHRLQSAAGILEWDEQVNLPRGSAEFRSEQSAALAGLLHREETSSELGDLIARLEAAGDSSSEETVVVREARRNFDRASRLPEAFVARRSEARSRAFHAWAEAREKNKFSLFAPHLKEQLSLAIEEAGHMGREADPYDYWIDQFDPGVTAGQIQGLFTPLRERLVPLVQRIVGSGVATRSDALRGFPIVDQESFVREVIGKLGFDFNRGRLDRSLHPFCSGCGFDTRLTTRFFEDNPLDSLFSAVHEAGHGMYEQGLPSDAAGTALGEAVGMAVHESQSRLWENQVARSRHFWAFWEPRYRATFESQLAGISSEELYRAINSVGINPIRVDSDEVTYNLHIILRFELEQALFDGSLSVADLPAAWNDLSESILGMRPKNDTQGVLQDVHWSGGAFGYFPSYCLGNMMAAQLWYAARKAMPDMDERFASGDFSGLLDWLRENVHQHGKLHGTSELVRRVTGRELGPDDLMRYLEERYLPLYESDDDSST